VDGPADRCSKRPVDDVLFPASRRAVRAGKKKAPPEWRAGPRLTTNHIGAKNAPDAIAVPAIWIGALEMRKAPFARRGRSRRWWALFWGPVREPIEVDNHDGN